MEGRGGGGELRGLKGSGEGESIHTLSCINIRNTKEAV